MRCELCFALVLLAAVSAVLLDEDEQVTNAINGQNDLINKDLSGFANDYPEDVEEERENDESANLTENPEKDEQFDSKKDSETSVSTNDALWGRAGFRSFRGGFRGGFRGRFRGGFRGGFRRRAFRRSLRRFHRYRRTRGFRRPLRRYIRKVRAIRRFRRWRKPRRVRKLNRFRRSRLVKRFRTSRIVRRLRRSRLVRRLRRSRLARRFRRSKLARHFRRHRRKSFRLRRFIHNFGKRFQKLKNSRLFKGLKRFWHAKTNKNGKKKGIWLWKRRGTSKKSWLKKYGKAVANFLKQLLGNGGGGSGTSGSNGGGGGGSGPAPQPTHSSPYRFINIMFHNNLKGVVATIIPSRKDAGEIAVPPGRSVQFHYEELNQGKERAVSFAALNIKESTITPLLLNNLVSLSYTPITNNWTLYHVNISLFDDEFGSKPANHLLLENDGDDLMLDKKRKFAHLPEEKDKAESAPAAEKQVPSTENDFDEVEELDESLLEPNEEDEEDEHSDNPSDSNIDIDEEDEESKDEIEVRPEADETDGYENEDDSENDGDEVYQNVDNGDSDADDFNVDEDDEEDIKGTL